MATPPTRGVVLATLMVLVASACGGGFGGASPGAGATGQGGQAGGPVTLRYLVDDSQATQARANGLIEAYKAKNPNVTIELETRPGGTEGDNIVKTRLSTGEMTDIFWYNSGSLLQALNPSQTLVDLAGEAFVKNLSETYVPTVSQGQGIYGVPSETAMGGGILYNRKVYADLGLQVPKTWAEFAANNEKIKAAGIAPVAATFADTWTSQLFVLADFHNVQAAVPDFAQKYTANQAHYSDTPAALAGFRRLEEAFKKGWWQKDFGAAKLDEGLSLVATGKAAHYPMLSFTLDTIRQNHPNEVQNIGFFGQPGDDASKNGATIWLPASTYIAKTSKNVDAAKAFLAFIASLEGAETLTKAVAPSGPYVINGAKLPDDVLPAVKDIQAYLDGGAATPALEFLSPVKGPSLEQITVAVGSGLNTAEQGARLYDQDVQKQAKQLNLPGW